MNGDWIGIGLTVFGLGFTLWAFYVRAGKQSLENMGKSITELSGVKISHLEETTKQIREDTRDILRQQRDITDRVSKLEGIVANGSKLNHTK